MKLLPVLLLLLTIPAFGQDHGAPAADHGSGEESKKPLPPPQPDGPDNINTFLHLQVNSLTKAQAPKVIDRKLLLTWKGDVQPRYVAAAFQHEAFRVKHVFWKNQYGVYFLVYDLASDSPSTLAYRLVVDGLWQGDPMNPGKRDAQGNSFSQVSLKSSDLPSHHGPVMGYYGEVEFAFHAKPGLQVAVIGNFNQWDPFAHFLEEEHPGEYHIKLVLPAGTILYQFVVGTRTVLDPGNAHTGHDAQGGTFSYFENTVRKPSTILESTMAVASAGH